MGVQGLWTILEPAGRPVRLETMARKRLAIDSSLWIYQFLKAVRDKEGNQLHNSHIVGFFRRIAKLLYHGIKPVFVFDGEAPSLKRQTIAKRKQTRAGKRVDATSTVTKLLAMRHVNQTVIQDSEPQIQKKHFHKKDDYHLPELEVPFEQLVNGNDPRIISSADWFDMENSSAMQEMGVFHFSDMNFDSVSFKSLPFEDQYNIINAARLRSRLRMGLDTKQLAAKFPDRLEFSKFQIQRVKERNEYTQRLMNINNMNEFDAMRLAGDQNREYILIKNEKNEAGYALGLVEKNNIEYSNLKSSQDKNQDNDQADVHFKIEDDEDDKDDAEFLDVPIASLPKIVKNSTHSISTKSLPKARNTSKRRKYSRNDLFVDTNKLANDIETQTSPTSQKSNKDDVANQVDFIPKVESDNDSEIEIIKQKTELLKDTKPEQEMQPIPPNDFNMKEQSSVDTMKKQSISSYNAGANEMASSLNFNTFEISNTKDHLIGTGIISSKLVSTELAEKMSTRSIEKTSTDSNIYKHSEAIKNTFLESSETIAVEEYVMRLEDEQEMIADYKEEEKVYDKMLDDIIGREDNQKIQKQYSNNLKLLEAKQKKERRDADEVTQAMIRECQELLRLFGLPYIVSPMEAEAQCAALLHLGLVDGIVTDDSDVFLFGGDMVYRHMFSNYKYVEIYQMTDLRKEFGLNRENLIKIAKLLGSDYTEGISRVGPVKALEILGEFTGRDSLQNFKSWVRRVQTDTETDQDNTPFRKKFRKTAKNLEISDNFLNSQVDVAYLNPEVDLNEEQFIWGTPDIDGIRQFLMSTIGWSYKRCDEVLLPVIRDMNNKLQQGVQENISNYFQNNGETSFAPRKKYEFKSHLLRQAMQNFKQKSSALDTRSLSTIIDLK